MSDVSWYVSWVSDIYVNRQFDQPGKLKVVERALDTAVRRFLSRAAVKGGPKLFDVRKRADTLMSVIFFEMAGGEG